MVHGILDRLEPDAFDGNGLCLAVIENALPEAYYAVLAASFPPSDVVADTSDFENNKVYRKIAVDALEDRRIPEIWREFIEFHSSKTLFDRVRERLGDAIARCHPTLEDNFGKPGGDLTAARRCSGKADAEANRIANVTMDCQLSINSPVTTPTSVRGPRLDSPHKLFAGLLYFRHPEDDSSGGDLEFYRLTRSRYPRPKPSRIDAAHVERVRKVPYRANTLVFFINSPLAIHGVTPRSVTSIERRYVTFWVNAIGARPTTSSSLPSRRHRRGGAPPSGSGIATPPHGRSILACIRAGDSRPHGVRVPYPKRVPQDDQQSLEVRLLSSKRIAGWRGVGRIGLARTRQA